MFNKIGQIQKIDKYQDKSIRFYDKNTHYDLIFSSSFEQINQSTPVYTDLLCDLKQADKSKEIHVWVHSHGGDCTTLMMICQQLNEFEYVVTIGLGEIDSAGFMLWSRGDERYLAPTTICMYHGLSSGQFGKARELKEYSSFIEKYQDIFSEGITDILTEEQIEKGRYTQIWILGKELIERNKAIDYKYYSRREKMQMIQAYRYKEDVYIKDKDGFYYEICETSNGINKKQLMKGILDEEPLKYPEGIVDFVDRFFLLHQRVLEFGGKLRISHIYQCWKMFSQKEYTENDLIKNIIQYMNDELEERVVSKVGKEFLQIKKK